MKICVTSQGKDLNSEIDSRFGRCSYFIFYDTDTMEYEVVENPWKEASGGAGIQAAQLVVSKGVKYVITGKLGPNAENVVTAAGISVINKSGKISEILKEIKKSL